MSKKRELLIIIGEDIFEVSKFVNNHPGEGIHDVYLTNYNRKNVSSEYEHYHFDNEPDEWLDKAKSKIFDDETGIYYVGPIGSWFSKKIPIWFHSFQNEQLEHQFWESQDNTKSKVFIVKCLPRNDVTKGVQLIYRSGEEKKELIELWKRDNKWVCLDPFSNVELVDISLEKIVDQLVVKRDYHGV